MKYQTHFTFNLSNSGQRAAFLTFLLLVLCVTAYAQVGIGTNAPNDKAQLDIVSSNKGILIPRIGESIKEAMTDIPEGLLIYQTDGDAGFYYFTGSVWEKLVPASSITPPSTIIPYASGTPIALSVNVDGTPNIHSIVGFGSNVSQTTPLDNDIIQPSGTTNLAFTVPKDGTIKSISGTFTIDNIFPEPVFSSVQVKVGVFVSGENDNTFSLRGSVNVGNAYTESAPPEQFVQAAPT